MADHLGIFCGAGFLIQLVFCFLNRTLWIRTGPVLALAGCMAVQMLRYFVEREAYALLSYMGWGAVLLSAVGAWLVYGAVKAWTEGKE